ALAASGARADTAQKASAAVRPWYATGFEELGFKVFPEPVPVDDFSARMLSGGSSKLSESRGKIVLLNFWATWCPPCREEIPSIQTLWTAMKGKSFSIMGVSIGETEATVRDFVAKNKMSYPVFLDSSGEIGTAFGARSIPTTYVIDKTGRAIAGIVGGAPYDSPKAAALFAELAAR
ncbi:MAG TPA: TlpA disulfide reductase family protein, partial [Rectinemataceae bacterium]|nr:TlpA disulfide reductase family protein [Rectinemataceae bacterium]